MVKFNLLEFVFCKKRNVNREIKLPRFENSIPTSVVQFWGKNAKVLKEIKARKPMLVSRRFKRVMFTTLTGK